MEQQKENANSVSVLPKELQWVEQVTYLLDSSFSIPFTNMRFGIDPVIGLIPMAGEMISFSISALLILAMVRHGTSGMLALRMIGNVLFDTMIGAVPVAGDVFDFFRKANRRNLTLLKEYHAEGKHKGSGWWAFVIISLIFMGLGTLLFYGLWKIISGIGGLINGLIG